VFVCNKLWALHTAFEYPVSLDIDLSNQDMGSAIHHYKNNSPLCWTYIHVKGHQDVHNELGHLDQ